MKKEYPFENPQSHSKPTASTKQELMKNALCDVCHRMWALGWVAANDGNVSVMLENNLILCTPSGISKGDMTPDRVLTVNRDGKVIEGTGRPSTELAMHLRCYAEREDVRAVVHAHPPYSTAFAVANRALDSYAMIETICSLGAVPVAPYATPGTDEVPDSIAPFLAKHDAILLRAHGALTVGTDLKTAYYRMETLEHFAKISLFAHQLGGAVDISRERIDILLERRESFYHFTGKHPGYVKFHHDNEQ
jgi:L-fuculose-phosphate aldolase